MIKAQGMFAFETTPLITVASIVADWRAIFSRPNCPPWVKAIECAHDETDVLPEQLIVVVGKSNRRVFHLSPFSLAPLFELTRFGHSIVTNSNHAKPIPQVYLKMSFKDAPGSLVSVRRILFGAGGHEETKAHWRENDYDPDNTYAQEHHHPKNDSRAVAMEHAERLAREREEAGTLPGSVNVDAYLANLRLLFAWLDNARSPSNFHPADPRSLGDA